jgi:broad specificity phosphatase PhoE
MKIYLIRHGETTGDEEDRYGGDYDDHLSENGQKQVNELAEKLVGKEIEIIYRSPKVRAKETAQVVGEKLNIELKEINDFRERNQYGVLSGLTKAEAKEKFPEEVEKLKIHPYKNHVSNSESYEDFFPRIINVFKEVIAEEKETIAIITHGGPIKALFREFFKFGEFKTLGDCAIIEINKKEDKFELVAMDNAELE